MWWCDEHQPRAFSQLTVPLGVSASSLCSRISSFWARTAMCSICFSICITKFSIDFSLDCWRIVYGNWLKTILSQIVTVGFLRGSLDRQMDGQTGWFQYTPANFVAGSIMKAGHPIISRCHIVGSLSARARISIQYAALFLQNESRTSNWGIARLILTTHTKCKTMLCPSIYLWLYINVWKQMQCWTENYFSHSWITFSQSRISIQST